MKICVGGATVQIEYVRNAPAEQPPVRQRIKFYDEFTVALCFVWAGVGALAVIAVWAALHRL